MIDCRLCGEPTVMTGTKLCDRCWELERRIHRDPQLAFKILQSMPPLVDPETGFTTLGFMSMVKGTMEGTTVPPQNIPRKPYGEGLHENCMAGVVSPNDEPFRSSPHVSIVTIPGREGPDPLQAAADEAVQITDDFFREKMLPAEPLGQGNADQLHQAFNDAARRSHEQPERLPPYLSQGDPAAGTINQAKLMHGENDKP